MKKTLIKEAQAMDIQTGTFIQNYRRITNIKHPKQDEDLTKFYIFNSKNDEYIELTQDEIEQLPQSDNKMVKSNKDNIYRIHLSPNGHFIGVYN